ncbi:MAG: hypothetical protein PHY48_12190 [Candidatus Cloacimonetes bacterium]|nr:hypothetical protein [Candidatus Cloacimonadota bacterium]
MKVHFKNLIGGYTGQADDSVIYYHPGINRYIIRSKGKHKTHAGNMQFKAICDNLKQLQLSQAYVQDFKDYLQLYNHLPSNRDNPLPAWNNLWLKLMWSMQRIMGVQLLSLTNSQIAEDTLPCISVKAAVEAGLLPKVKGWEGMVAQM